MGDFLIYDQDGAVVTLTMNLPEMRNTLSGQMQCDDFVETCARINRDHSVKVVILTGAGSAFSAGGNVKAMRERTETARGTPIEVRSNYRTGIQRIPLALYELEVPTIAAVNGPAIGAGCDLACMCDIRIASERAIFAESFVKLGICPGDGGAWLMPRTVPMSVAAEMIFTGDTIDAQQALAWGLVSKVVPPERLMEEARTLADRIACNPGHALRLSKRLLREALHMRLDASLELAAAYQALLHETEEHREAVAALAARLEAKSKAKKAKERD